MLQVKRESQITFLHDPSLDLIPRIVHGFSTRRSERSDFSLGPVPSENPIIQTNRVRFLAAIGAPGWPILRIKQVHSGVVVDMEDTSAASEAPSGDAAVTALEGVILGIQTADCVPILVADKDARCVAAIHAGWRGTAALIAAHTIRRLQEKFGIAPSGLTAVIGPHIGVCCYEVGDDVVTAIADPAAFSTREDWLKPHLNLAEANRKQLLKAGIPKDQVSVSSLCTQCRSDLFFSYRREGTRAGRMISVIGITP
jgi:YfiH family protein